MTENKFVVRINESAERSKWLELISKSPFATPFQSPQFYDFCNSTPFHQGFVCAVEDNDNTYIALCVADIIKEKGIKAYFSRRAIVYGGPLLEKDSSDDALTCLIENLHYELKKRAIYIEIRNLKDYSGYSSVFTSLDWKTIPWMNVRKRLNYQNRDELLHSFKYNRRREILLTIKSGFQYHEASNEKEVAEVYGILNDLYKNKIGLPLPSLQYFKDFRKTGLMKVFSVTDQDTIVGGSFCLVSGIDAIYTFYYCGKRNYKPRTYPSHLAVLAAMEYGMQNGMKFLDFMGAGKPGEEYGVRNYKMEFGGDLVEEGRYLKVENKFLYMLGLKVINFMRKRKPKQINTNGIREKVK